MAVGDVSVARLEAVDRVRTAAVVGAGFTLALISGPLIGLVGSRAVAAVLAVAAAVVIALLMACVPVSGALLAAGAALLVEQYPMQLADRLTEHVMIFRSLNTAGLGGLFVTPSELLVGAALLLWLTRGMARRDLQAPRSAVAAGLVAVLVAVAAAATHGLASGGELRIVIDEVRPFLYVAVLYLLASQLFHTTRHLWSLLWVVVLVTGFKGVQGSYRHLVLSGLDPAPEAILGHEEAVFFSIFILLTAGLWLFHLRGRLRWCATALLPFVVTADLANQRRTAWVILPLGLALLLVGACVHRVGRRRSIVAIGVAAAAASAVYLGAFWNGEGTAAQPARAIRSAFDPDERDSNSDAYRVIENLDLGIDIRQAGPLGIGFGRPIPHPIPLSFDATMIDPLIDYVPHNGVLYVWLRTGAGGAIALWFTIGSAAVLSCRVVRSRDPRLAIVGAMGLCTLAAYVLEGWFDQGLMVYRIAFFVGCTLGAVEAARRLGTTGSGPEPSTTPARGHDRPVRSAR